MSKLTPGQINEIGTKTLDMLVTMSNNMNIINNEKKTWRQLSQYYKTQYDRQKFTYKQELMRINEYFQSLSKESAAFETSEEALTIADAIIQRFKQIEMMREEYSRTSKSAEQLANNTEQILIQLKSEVELQFKEFSQNYRY